MDSVPPEERASACNVFFLDSVGAPFAGLYQDPKLPLLLFQEALQELVHTFHLQFEECPRLGAWILLPCGQRHTFDLGEPVHGVLAVDVYSEKGNMMKPIQPGSYYVLRQKQNSWRRIRVEGQSRTKCLSLVYTQTKSDLRRELFQEPFHCLSKNTEKFPTTE